MVGVGRRWGPRLPQLRPPAKDAPELLTLDEDMETVAVERWAWGQSWYPEVATAANAKERQRREAHWERVGKKLRWQPARHRAMCMWASSGRHLRLWDDEEIAQVLELSGTAARWHNNGRRDFKTVPVIVSRGDDIWASLGAWPWVAFADGHPPAEWWTLPEPNDMLRDAIKANLARAEQLSAWVRSR
jgi:hypothetical protein